MGPRCLPTWIVIVPFWLSLCSLTATERIIFDHYGLEKGLSQATVQATLQDRDGFIWAGTQSGLNRFDGYTFRQYRGTNNETPGLRDDWINVLLEDQAGHMWVATERGGLSLYDQLTDQFQHIPNVCRRDQGYAPIRTLLQDEDHLWLGGGHGLARLTLSPDLTVAEYREYRHIESLNTLVRKIVKDHQGALWLGTDAGLLRFDPLTEAVDKITLVHPEQRQTIFSLLMRDRYLWVGTNDGLFVIENQAPWSTVETPCLPDVLTPGQGIPISALYQGTTTKVWVGSHEGLYTYEPSSSHFKAITNDQGAHLAGEMIRTITEDRSGGLWIGTEMGGLNRLDLYAPKFDLESPSIGEGSPPSAMSAFLEHSSGTLWAASFGGGLYRYLGPGRFKHYSSGEGLHNDYIWALHEDAQGDIWIGTYGGGLALLDPESETFQAYRAKKGPGNHLAGDFIVSLAGAAQGGFWIATERSGLHHYSPPANRFQHWPIASDDNPGLPVKALTVLLEDDQRHLWLGSRHGLVRKNDQGEPFSLFRFGGSSRDFISCLAQDVFASEMLWVGTAAGLLHFHKDGTLRRHVSKADGLLDELVYGVAQVSPRELWLSTNRGLVRFDPIETTFRNFRQRDGLQSDEFNFAAYTGLRDGRLLFGNIKGYVAFDPDLIVENPFPPIVAITEILINNEVVHPGRADSSGRVALQRATHHTRVLELSHRDIGISFDVTALHYADPEHQQFQYRLEPFDPQWNTVGAENRRITYTNLKHNNYRLRLKAAGSNGIWSEEKTLINLKVTGPPLALPMGLGRICHPCRCGHLSLPPSASAHQTTLGADGRQTHPGFGSQARTITGRSPRGRGGRNIHAGAPRHGESHEQFCHLSRHDEGSLKQAGTDSFRSNEDIAGARTQTGRVHRQHGKGSPGAAYVDQNRGKTAKTIGRYRARTQGDGRSHSGNASELGRPAASCFGQHPHPDLGGSHRVGAPHSGDRGLPYSKQGLPGDLKPSTGASDICGWH